jgi:hypothetical protein
MELCTQHNSAADHNFWPGRRLAKMRARPSHLSRWSNPHTVMWIGPASNCTVAWRVRSFVVVAGRKLIKGPVARLSRKETTIDKRQALPRSSRGSSFPPLSLNLTRPHSSLTLLSIPLSLYLVSHNHQPLHLIHSTSFSINLLLSPFTITVASSGFATRRASPIHPTLPLDNTALCFAH